MSDQERQIALGRMLEEYGQAKQELALLYSKAEELGKHYKAIGDYLSSWANATGSKTLRMGADAGPLLHSLPLNEELASFVGEALATRERKLKLAATLKEAGHEVTP